MKEFFVFVALLVVGGLFLFGMVLFSVCGHCLVVIKDGSEVQGGVYGSE